MVKTSTKWIIGIVLVLLLVGGSIFALMKFGAPDWLGGNKIVNKLGINKAINSATQGIKSSSTKFTAWVKNKNSIPMRAAIIGVLAAPILAMIWLSGGKRGDKFEKIVLTAITLFIMLMISVSFPTLKSAYTGAWYISIVLLLRSGFKTSSGGSWYSKPQANDSFLTWTYFGVVSMFIAPFGSILVAGAQIPEMAIGTNAFVALFRLGFSPVGWLFGSMMMGVMFNMVGGHVKGEMKKLLERKWKENGWNPNTRKQRCIKCKKIRITEKSAKEEPKWTCTRCGTENYSDEEKQKKEAKKAEEEKKKNEKAENSVKKVEENIHSGDERGVGIAIHDVRTQIGAAEAIVHTSAEADLHVDDDTEQNLEKNEREVHEMVEKIDSLDYFETDLGKAHKYLLMRLKELGGTPQKKFVDGPTGNNWRAYFGFKKEGKYVKLKETIAIIKGSGSNYLKRRARDLSRTIEDKSIIKLRRSIFTSILRLNKNRANAKKSINKEFKTLIDSGNNVKRANNSVKKIYSDVSKNTNTLKRYDSKLKSNYKEIKEMLNEIDKIGVPIERKLWLITDVSRIFKWNIEYLGSKKQYKHQFAKKFKKAQEIMLKISPDIAENETAYVLVLKTYEKLMKEQEPKKELAKGGEKVA